MRTLAVALLGCAACSTAHPVNSQQPPQLGEPAPTLEDAKAEAEFQDILARHSQRAELYSGVEHGEDTRMFCAATFQSPTFREARVRRVGAFRVTPAAEIEQKLAQEKAEADQFDEFYFGALLVDYHFDDFDRANSVWRIALVGDGVEETPMLVERQGRATTNVRAIYPYMGDFWVGYKIRFNKLQQGRGEKLTLRIASTLGRVEMTFPAR